MIPGVVSALVQDGSRGRVTYTVEPASRATMSANGGPLTFLRAPCGYSSYVRTSRSHGRTKAVSGSALSTRATWYFTSRTRTSPCGSPSFGMRLTYAPKPKPKLLGARHCD